MQSTKYQYNEGRKLRRRKGVQNLNGCRWFWCEGDDIHVEKYITTIFMFLFYSCFVICSWYCNWVILIGRHGRHLNLHYKNDHHYIMMFLSHPVLYPSIGIHGPHQSIIREREYVSTGNIRTKAVLGMIYYHR